LLVFPFAFGEGPRIFDQMASLSLALEYQDFQFRVVASIISLKSRVRGAVPEEERISS